MHAMFSWLEMLKAEFSESIVLQTRGISMPFLIAFVISDGCHWKKEGKAFGSINLSIGTAGSGEHLIN